MIVNQDRSGYFGASDTKMIVNANRDTKSFKEWWEVKLGWQESNFGGSIYTEAGNRFEHPILERISEDIIKDGQIIIEKLKLRVNYDGWKDGIIYEVKTHKNTKDFEVSKAYWQQAQVEMYAYQEMAKELELPPFEKLYIVSYGLSDDDYQNEEPTKDDVNFDKVKFHPIKYSKGWIKGEYLTRLKSLVKDLEKERFPR